MREQMGEIISNNILLPIMYLLIDTVILLGIILLFMMLLEKILDSKIIKTIMRKIR
jgi:hypothetical protein|tara:strand:- start:155 stop:322 length:168 start_codon:yes stop_codon:yes gene_type:complete